MRYISKDEKTTNSLFYDGSNDQEFDIEKALDVINPKSDYVNEIDFHEATERAEGYLKWIGAKQDYNGQWSYDGDIICHKNNFLVHDGLLTVSFSEVTGYFVCDDMNLKSIDGLPYRCDELHIIHANLGTINWLPAANIYQLRDCGITYMNGSIFPSYVSNIDLSHNKLCFLPDMKHVTDLFRIDVSYNDLETLQGLPFVTEIIASCCKIKRISTDPVLFECLSEKIDLSTNELTDLKGLPATKKLDIMFNHNLTSFYGLDSSVASRQREAFKEIDASSSSIISLDHLPKSVYKLNLNNNPIKDLKSNTLEAVSMLMVNGCRELKEGDLDSRLVVEEIFFDSKCESIETFSSFRKNLCKINFSTQVRSIMLERDFYNTMSSVVSGNGHAIYDYESEESYYDFYLNFLHEKNFLKIENGFEDAKKHHHWPDYFLPKLKNFFKSQKSVSKFNL